MSKTIKRYTLNLITMAVIAHLGACMDTIAPQTGEGCESLASECPEQTECQLGCFG